MIWNPGLRQDERSLRPQLFKSGREARNAAFSAAVSTLPRVWRETLGVGGAKVPGAPLAPGRGLLMVGFMADPFGGASGTA